MAAGSEGTSDRGLRFSVLRQALDILMRADLAGKAREAAQARLGQAAGIRVGREREADEKFRLLMRHRAAAQRACRTTNREHGLAERRIALQFIKPLHAALQFPGGAQPQRLLELSSDSAGRPSVEQCQTLSPDPIRMETSRTESIGNCLRDRLVLRERIEFLSQADCRFSSRA